MCTVADVKNKQTSRRVCAGTYTYVVRTLAWLCSVALNLEQVSFRIEAKFCDEATFALGSFTATTEMAAARRPPYSPE